MSASVWHGSEYAMAPLIVNMGGEMLYILEQRLQAQAIVEEKSVRVLQDVISTMFSEKFICELFKPQKMYTSTSTRQIFDRLAHSSIMRLNSSSMDKLYDLMTMGCKYQVVSCGHPLDMYQVCLNHLDALRHIVRNAPEVSRLVENAASHMEELFARMRVSDLQLLRYTLARFFQDRRVKVSLFLTDQLQAQDGSIIHTHAGRMPVGTERPGTVRYFSNGVLKREEVIRVANAEHTQPTPPGIDVTKPGRPVELGINLYARDRRKTKGGAQAAAAQQNKAAAAAAPPAFEPDEKAAKAAKSELNLLAQMIGGRAKETEKFNLNLFPDTTMGGESGGTVESRSDIITFDVSDQDARASALTKQFGYLGLDDKPKASNSKSPQQDDLLDLMDQQGQDYDD